MGEKKRNNKTFTKAPWNVKPLLTLWRCVSIRFPQMGHISEKLFIIKDCHQSISTSFCESTADCSLVCSVSREDSSQSLTSCLNLLPSPMDPAGDRLPGKDSSQRYAWAWMCCFLCDIVHGWVEMTFWNLDLKDCEASWWCEQGCFVLQTHPTKVSVSFGMVARHDGNTETLNMVQFWHSGILTFQHTFRENHKYKMRPINMKKETEGHRDGVSPVNAYNS